MKRSTVIIVLFCAFGAHQCQDTVPVEVPVESGSNGERSGKMVNYDEYMGNLDGFPDWATNSNFDQGKLRDESDSRNEWNERNEWRE